MRGRLVYWNADRGFGFVARDRNKENNLFLHAVALMNGEVPKVGDMIECDVQVDETGRERARNAVIV